ncbi:hypothetical protein [Chryseobacterium tongliaoense]|uniref:hypothetical protein n=1 Tax=Chryseobacterium tongliaoense TaxID=3240933 RepID=UPI0035181F75
MKKFFLIIIPVIILITGQADLFAQNYNLHSVDIDNALTPTASVYSLGKYGNSSSVDNKGKYNQNISLVNLKTGNLNYSMNLQYSSNGLKLNDWGGRLGLLWSDNFTSVIYRVVRGIADGSSQKVNELGSGGGFSLEEYKTIRNMYESSSSGYTSGKDGESDIFYYNIFGLSGSFIIVNGEVIQLNYNKKIKIEAGASLSSFTITTDDGTKYSYGQNEMLEKTAYNTLCREEYATPLQTTSAWFLTKIESMDTKTINFQYTTISSQHVDDYNESFLVKNKTYPGDEYCVDPWGNPVPPVPQVMETFYCTRSKIFETKVLTKITSDDFTIDFYYNNREDIGNEKLLDHIDIKNTFGSVVNKIKFSYDKYGSNLSVPVHQEGIQIRYFLKEVKTGMNSDVSYQFQYNNPELLPRRFSNNIDLMGFYNGKNNTSLLPGEFVQKLYPLLTGGSFIPSIPYGDRTASFPHSQYGLLKKITFPTKGTESIEYEENKIIKDTISNLILPYYGVRTKTITLDGNGTQPVVKNYIYDKFKFNNVDKLVSENKPSSRYFNAVEMYNDEFGGFLTTPVDGIIFNCASSSGGPGVSYIRQAIFNFYKINSYSKYDNNIYGDFIAYENVTEILNQNSYTSNFYSVWEETTAIDLVGYHSLFYPLSNLRWKSNLNFANYFGTINNGYLVKKYLVNDYQYRIYKIIDNYTINRDYVPMNEFSNNIAYIDENLKAYSVAKYLLLGQWFNKTKTTETTILDDGEKIAKETEFSYYDITGYNNLKSVANKYSDITTDRKDLFYSYTGDFLQNYMVGIPVKTEEFKNDKITGRTYYRYSKVWWHHEKMFPSGISKTNLNALSPDNEWTDGIKFDQYDNKGNLLQYTSKSGVPTTILYGYNKTLPIAKIEGLDYTVFLSFSSLGVNASGYDNLEICQKSNADINAASEEELMIALNNFRKNPAVSGYPITTYTYDPLVGVTSITSPSGITEKYIYDPVTNRLKETKQMEKDSNGNYIYKNSKEYQYNYKQ